jgi:hypothetical protein
MPSFDSFIESLITQPLANDMATQAKTPIPEALTLPGLTPNGPVHQRRTGVDAGL